MYPEGVPEAGHGMGTQGSRKVCCRGNIGLALRFLMTIGPEAGNFQPRSSFSTAK